jgi:sulfite reductase subunit B
MKILSKEDFSAFVNTLIQNDSMDVEGVISKGDMYAFGTLDSADDLRLDYDVTILPPKKYFLPQYETLMTFDLADPDNVAKPAVVRKTVIIGIHPYDLVAIQQMDKYFLDTNVDDNYLQKRKNTILIGLMPVNVSEKAFYGNFVKALGGPPEVAFDLMLTDLGEDIAVEPGSDTGEALLGKAKNARDASSEEKEQVNALGQEAMGKATRDLKVSPKAWSDLLGKSYDSDVWAEQAEKCLACGTCTLVCPTCFCYDVTDEVNLDVTTGERKRTWDGCLLRDFTKVSTGEIFREKTEDRYRHRFNRKGRYLPDNLGFLACVGCGRCASQCIPDIADPVELFNMLAEAITEPVEESARPLYTGPVDIAGIPEGDFLYIPKQATIKRVEKLTDKETLFEISLDSGKPLGHEPGQFVEVSVMGTGEAPISVSSAPGGDTFEIVVRKVGDVTSKLHTLQPDDKVGIRGPFGKGFDVEGLKGKNLLFIGGGLGIVPMRSLFNHVLNNRDDFGEVTILYGCKEPCELMFHEEVGAWSQRKDIQHMLSVDSCTEDEGWEGEIGVITTLLPKVTFDASETIAIVVGPPIMYRFVNRDLLNLGMPEENIIVSLERRMKCGVGKCGHCQINGVYVCKEGPVFNYKEIKDQPEAF